MRSCRVAAAVLLAAPAPGAAAVPEEWVETGEPADGAERVPLFAALKRRGAAEIRRTYREASDPDHPNYAAHLSYAEAAALSRPLPHHSAAVTRWLAAHGATGVREHPHRDSVRASVALRDVERMTGGAFRVYRHRATGARVARMTGAVALPADVAAAVDFVGGFADFPLEPRVAARAAAGDNQRHLVTPKVIAREHNVTEVAPHAQNIHAFGQFQGNDFVTSDPPAFCKRWHVEGDCKVAKIVGSNSGGADVFESSLDSEYINGAGQAVPTWVYGYDGKDFCTDFTQFLSEVVSEETYPYVISVSYGSQHKGACSKSVASRAAADVEKLAAMGITLVLASGDSGSGQVPRQGNNRGWLVPGWPTSIPAALAVGSTQFATHKDDNCGTCTGEQVATERFGSGGGFSLDYPLQDYQANATAAYIAKTKLPEGKYAVDGHGAATGRATPDVAFLGDDFAVMAEGLNWTVGGTSASAPAFASMLSLLNAERLNGAGKTLGSVNALLYKHPELFTDITKGTNGVKDDSGHGSDAAHGFRCEAGWDAVTGLGTPVFSRMLELVRDLNARDREEAAQFAAFKARYGRAYADAAEERRRFGVFRASLRAAAADPAGGVTPSDLTDAEFRGRNP